MACAMLVSMLLVCIVTKTKLKRIQITSIRQNLHACATVGPHQYLSAEIWHLCSLYMHRGSASPLSRKCR